MKLILSLFLFLVVSKSYAKEIVISQKDKKFDKAEITIAPGDVLVFQNDEKDITHNVYSLGPKNAFELKTQPPCSTSPTDCKSKVEFKDEGETDVECAIHTGMKLKVKVKK